MNRERNTQPPPRLGMWIIMYGAKQGLMEGRGVGL